MQVNTEVYGAASTWRRDAEGFSSSEYVPDDMQFKRGQYNRLMDYVSNDRMSYGSPIDYSICYAAQAEGMPLASLRTWYIPYINGAYQVHTFKRNKKTGWFFGHQITNWNEQAYQIYNPKAILSDALNNQYIKKDCWIPEGVAASYPDQQSALVIPIVEFPTKGVYFGIRCRIFRPSDGSNQLKWLSELRTGDWSAWRIIAAWGECYTYRNSDADFTGVYSWGTNITGVCINETLEFSDAVSGNKGLPFLKYCQFMLGTGNLPLYGWISGNATYDYVGGSWHAMQRQFNAYYDYSSTAPIFTDTVPDTTFNEINYSSWGKAIEGFCLINTDNMEAIRKAAAAYGLFFTEQNPQNLASNANRWINSAMFCGILDSEGVGHGEYTQGTGNRDNSVYSMGSSQNSDYIPGGGGGGSDTNTYSSQTYFNPVLNLSSMCKRYVLNDAAVEQLCRDLWKISDDLIHTDPNEDFKDYDQLMLDNFLVNSPIDVIVSLDKYPISDIPTGTNSEPIKYGKASGAALGKPLTVNTIFFNFSGVDIFPKFGRSFLDYSPYTTYELYIPFCGVIQIDAGDIMDHTLSVQMVMDLSTGAVTAYVMADNLCIETANGSAALNIPVSGIDSITLNSQINNALINAKSAQMQARSSGTLTGIVGGGLKNTVENLNAKTNTMRRATDTWTANLADYELTHQQLNPHKIGSASAACSWSLELTCRLMIYYPEGDAIDSSGGVSRTSPKLADLTLYGHTTGFSCISSGAVSNYHGFTVGNIDTSSITGATEQERDMIKSLFARGVYLP